MVSGRSGHRFLRQASSACFTRGAVKGSARRRLPVALAIALAIAAAAGPCEPSPTPRNALGRLVEQHHLDLRHLFEAQDRVVVPRARGHARAVEAHRLLERPARRLDDAALDLVDDAVRIDDLPGIDRRHRARARAPAARAIDARLRRRPRSSSRGSCSARSAKPRPRGRRPSRRFQPARCAVASITARARGSFRWRRRNSTGSTPAAAASSSMNDSSANTLA